MGNRHSLEYQHTGLGYADLTTKEGKEELSIASRVQLRNTVKKLIVELKMRHGIIALLCNHHVTDNELESKDCFSHQVQIVNNTINVIGNLKRRAEEAEENNRELISEIDAIRTGLQKATGLGQDYQKYIKGLAAQIQESQREIFRLSDANKQLKNELSKGNHTRSNDKYHARSLQGRHCKDCEYLQVEMELLKLNELLQPNEEFTVLHQQLENVMHENQRNKTLERQLSHQKKEKSTDWENTRHQLRELDGYYFTEIETQKGILQLQLKKEREQMRMQIQQLQCDLKRVEDERLNINKKMQCISEKVNLQEDEYNNLVIQMVEDHKKNITKHIEQSHKIQNLEHQISECKTAHRCVVCLERLKCVAYMPCNHLATCEQCDNRLSQRICPIDRTQIESSLKIFNS